MNYSILTFITNNYETVREIDNPQDNVEYILVTDNKDIKSNTWKVVYEPLLDNDWMSGIAKALIIKYNAYKYVSNDIFVRMDHSLGINKSLDKLVEEFNSCGYDVLAMEHSFHHDFATEYNSWIEWRGLDQKYYDIFNEKTKDLDYDKNWKGLFETTFQFYRKSDTLVSFFNDMKHMLFNGDFSDCDKNDQCYNTILLQSKYNDTLKTWLVSNQLMWGDGCYFTMYEHGSNKENTDRRDLCNGLINQYGWWRGEIIILDFFK